MNGKYTITSTGVVGFFFKNKILFKSLELIVLTEIMFHDNTFKKVKIQEN